MSAAQYAARFAPTAASVSAIRDYLSSNGLKVGATGAQNSYVAFSGTVAAAERAFGVSINDYKHNGATVQAPGGALSVPSSLAFAVLTVEGLDTSEHFATTSAVTDAPPPAGFRNARPCSIFYGQVAAKYQADFSTPLPKFDGKTLAYAPCGYTGPFRAAYEGSTGLDGSGVTVAIVDAYAAPTIASDANEYRQNGDGSYAAGQFEQTEASKFTHQLLCGPSGWYGEETLDVEAVHAMAPGAKIRYYGAASCEDTDLVDALAQDRHRRQGPARHQLVGRAGARARRQTPSPLYGPSSWRARSRGSASCSPRATTATSAPARGSSRPTTRPRTRS